MVGIYTHLAYSMACLCAIVAYWLAKTWWLALPRLTGFALRRNRAAPDAPAVRVNRGWAPL